MEPLGFRVLFGVALVLNLAVSAVFRARARREETIPRSAESPGIRLVRVVIALPSLIALLIYLFTPRLIAWASMPLPDAVRWVGVVIGLLAPLLTVWVLRTIGSNVSETVLTKRQHELVTAGPYRWVRHPLYSVALLHLVALSVVAANWLIAALVVLGGVVIRTVIVPREEANLSLRFGERYQAYRHRTGGLFPRVWG